MSSVSQRSSKSSAGRAVSGLLSRNHNTNDMWQGYVRSWAGLKLSPLFFPFFTSFSDVSWQQLCGGKPSGVIFPCHCETLSPSLWRLLPIVISQDSFNVSWSQLTKVLPITRAMYVWRLAAKAGKVQDLPWFKMTGWSSFPLWAKPRDECKDSEWRAGGVQWCPAVGQASGWKELNVSPAYGRNKL